MTMKDDDYLWDPAATADPDVEQLERVLGRLRSTAPAPEIQLKPDTTRFGAARETAPAGGVRIRPDRTVYVGARFLGPALAAAAAIVLMVGSTWRSAATNPGEPTNAAASWEISTLVGTPRIGSTVLAGQGRIGVGQTLTTDAGSRAQMQVSDIGQITVDGGSRVRLVDTREGHHRLALDRGTLHAAIAAPPGQFVVDTPSATATDLGCVYSLHVDEDGLGMLSVEVGWVAFEERGRESFVPMGASSRTDRASGPGTPRYDDTDQAFREAIDDIDTGRDPARRSASLRFVLEHARARDAMTLWHLIPRVYGAERGAVVDALAVRVPAPPDVSRDAVLRLDRAALDRWWDLLGLNEASWWRKWKVGAPATAVGIKETARITISGPGVAPPIEVTEARVLALSNVYAGAFIGAPASEPDAAWPRYAVTFDIQTRAGVKTGAYVIDYVKSRWTGEGFVHLPGRGDDRYRINIGTIMRGAQDGAWHHAAATWSEAINAQLP
jgi:hypothetical protein